MRTLAYRIAAAALPLAAIALFGCGTAGVETGQAEDDVTSSRESDAAPAVVVLHLEGGYNALFANNASLVGKLGVTNSNRIALGSGLSVDKATLGSLSPWAREHMAAVGVRHGQTEHREAIDALWTAEGESYGLRLACRAMERTAIPAAVAGRFSALLQSAPVEGCVYQHVMSFSALGPALAFDPSPVAASYGVRDDAVDDLATKFAAAEILVTAAKTNVVVISDAGWDSHGDVSGSADRTAMANRVMPPLRTFIERVVTPAPNRRPVTLAIVGDFLRTPDSEHGDGVVATVIGPDVKTGVSFATNASGRFSPATPGSRGLWSYLAAVSRVPTDAFGPNPHGALVAADGE